MLRNLFIMMISGESFSIIGAVPLGQPVVSGVHLRWAGSGIVRIGGNDINESSVKETVIAVIAQQSFAAKNSGAIHLQDCA